MSAHVTRFNGINMGAVCLVSINVRVGQSSLMFKNGWEEKVKMNEDWLKDWLEIKHPTSCISDVLLLSLEYGDKRLAYQQL